MRYFFCFILFIYALQLKGQQVEVVGTVVDSNGLELPHIHVLNKNSHQGTTTGKTGRFKILAQVNDTLVFSSIQHLKQLYIVENRDTVHIILSTKNRILPDIILSPGYPFLDTTANKAGDINLNLPFKNNLVVRPYEERQYDVLKPKVAFYGIGVAASVLGSFTKEYKELKTLREVKAKDKPKLEFYSYFEEEFYTKSLDISRDKVHMFKEYCLKRDPMISTYLKQDKLYVLIERLKELSIEFKEEQSD